MIELPPGALVLGVISGLTYGVLAVGLLLVYRTSGIVNFAHGNVGSLASAVMARLTLTLGLPWIIGFPIALAAGAAAAALLEIGVMRRLRAAPRVMAVVATLGAAQLLLGLAGSITHVRSTALFAAPIDLSFEVGPLVVTPYYILILVLTPIIVGALALFLAPPDWLPRWLRSRHGPALRAAADNPDAASTIGISTQAMSAIAWAVSGALAGFSAILIAPTRGFQTIDALGPDLLVRALAPAVLAGMWSLPRALVAGVGVGIVERALIWNRLPSGWVDGGLFLLILAGLLVRRRQSEAAADSSWLTMPVDRPAWASSHMRRLARLGGIAGIAVLAGLPLLLTNAAASAFVSIYAIATIGLSLVLVTGISGQISLGQFALAGMGALAGYVTFIRLDLPWGPAVVAAAGAGAIASLVIGLPALRLRGLMLAVTSLAFAVASPGLILGTQWGFSTGVDPGRPIIGTSEITSERAYYYLALSGLALSWWLVGNVKRGGLGRILRAIRDSEDGARAFGVAPTSRKLQNFALAGAIAGIGGLLYAQSLARVTIDTFPAARSISLLAMVVLGGVGRMSGALLGAGYLVGLPLLLRDPTVELLVSGTGLLVFVLYVPGGLSQLLDAGWASLVRRSRARPPAQEPRRATNTGAIGTGTAVTPGPRDIILATERLTVSYGSVTAVNDVSLRVYDHEVLGIIGPNGSGKTTLFKALSGFARPDHGKILLRGREITALRPEVRARRGLVRSFQDSLLFPTLSVEEAVKLGFELSRSTRFTTSVIAMPPARRAERAKSKEAMELIELLGLARYRDTLIGELSTGTRRIAEMCCMLALRPQVLLLDEPSSGIAQRESEALKDLLLAVKRHLQTTLVVIEHDIPLILGISDRIIAMAEGSVIDEGAPADIQQSKRVLETYLG